MILTNYMSCQHVFLSFFNDRKHIHLQARQLCGWWSVDISELWLEGDGAEGVEVIAAPGLTKPTEQGCEEQQSVHEQRHFYDLAPSQALVADQLHCDLFFFHCDY